MTRLSDQDIEAIARKIAGELGGSARPAARAEAAPALPAGGGMFATVDEAVKAARAAQPKFAGLTLEKRNRIIAAIRATMREQGAALAKSAHDETGLGRYEDKVLKNQLVTEKTPGTEDLQPQAYTGDHGLTLVEPAPFGIIGAITPTTNPTSTIICNTIGMLAAGNAVVFNAHPSAKRCSAETIVLINKAITGAGGPANIVCGVATPTVESAQELMKHPGIRILVVTGGGGVVKAAMASGKRAICAGPGNPPVVVDETADISQAARDIVTGSSFDNNIICVDEKEVIVVDSVASALVQAMQRNDAVLLDPSRMAQVENLIFTKNNGPRQHSVMNKDMIGKNAGYILNKIGLSVPPSTRLAFAVVNQDHPLLWTEQMMPILPVTRVPTVDAAIDLAVEMEDNNRHTFVMHGRDIDSLSRMARECNASIFVKNGRAVAGLGYGGEGFTSFTIASPTGEGLTSARHFSRWRRCVMVDQFRIV